MSEDEPRRPRRAWQSDEDTSSPTSMDDTSGDDIFRPRRGSAEEPAAFALGDEPAAELGDTPSPAWAPALDQVLVRGNRITTEVVFFHRPSATILFTDLIQHFPPGWFRGWRALVARLDLMTAPQPSVPRKFRAAFVDRAAARIAVRRILEWPAIRVVMAHGPPVGQDGQAFVASAFRWLTG